MEMKRISKNKITTLKILGLITCFGTLSLVGLTGCAGDHYSQSTGEHIDDRATSSRVKSALGANPEYKFAEVNVATFKGRVQLSGFVNAKAQKSTAGDIAKDVEGVKEVANNITVK
jgi:hyperosmotically inducible protein